MFLVLLGDLFGFGGLAPTLQLGKIVDRLMDLLSNLGNVLESAVEAFVLWLLRILYLLLKLLVELDECSKAGAVLCRNRVVVPDVERLDPLLSS